jgi:hypothetical protein
MAGTGISLGAVLGLSSTAQAAPQTFVVDTNSDTNLTACLTNTAADCSLRGALNDAAANDNLSDVDQITFGSNVTGTITLAGTRLPTIDEPLNVTGPGAGSLTISANDMSQVFFVRPTNPGADVTIAGLTIADGRATTIGGAGLYSYQADLSLQSVAITGNDAVNGPDCGGAFIGGGTFTLSSSTIAGNTNTGVVNAAGAGLCDDLNSQTTIRNSTISGNTATGTSGVYGAGLYITGGFGTISDSTIYGNTGTAPTGVGGGMDIAATSGISIRDTTVSNNQLLGGSVAASGGGVNSGFNSVDPDLNNTIVANNTVPGTGNGPDLFTNNDTLSVVFSLIENPAGGSTSNPIPGSNLTGVDPQLGPLASNGGPTQTMLPALASPVVDRGGSTVAVPYDQRGPGFPRIVDIPSIADSPLEPNSMPGVDMGAVEVPAPATTPPGGGGNPTPAPPVTKKKKCKKKAKKRSAAAAKKCKKKK